MRTTIRFVMTFLCVAGISALAQETDPARWIGMKAPEFRLASTDGAAHRLSDFTATGPVVVLWIPKVYTGNVTRLLKSADAVAPELASKHVTLLGASCDKTKYLTPYAQEIRLSIPILADPTRTTAIAWGVVHEGREIPQRWAYFVGRDGRIAAVLSELEAATAGERIRAETKRLGWLD